MSSRNVNVQASSATMGSDSLSILADPPIKQVDGAAMDYFLIELVHTIRQSSVVATARAKKIEQEMIEAGLIPPSSATQPLKKDVQPGGYSGDSPNVASRGVNGKARESEEDEIVRTRLEAIGMHVGANFSERLCRDRPQFTDTLDAIKFICKDLWAACWDKQVDNLRTNHRGVYVLQDNSFKPISRLSSWEGRADATKRARVYVAFSVGVIRGALSRLGLQGTVTPEISSPPQCTFQIKLPKTT